MVHTRSAQKGYPTLTRTPSSNDNEPIYDTSRSCPRVAARKVASSRAPPQSPVRDDGKRKALGASVKAKAGQPSSSIPAKNILTKKVARKHVAKDPPMAEGIFFMSMHFLCSSLLII